MEAHCEARGAGLRLGKRKYDECETESSCGAFDDSVSSLAHTLFQESVSSLESPLPDSLESLESPQPSLADGIYHQLLGDEVDVHIVHDPEASLDSLPSSKVYTALRGWLATCARRLALSRPTLHIACGLLDRCFVRGRVGDGDRLVIAMACLMLGAKYMETQPPEVSAFLHFLRSKGVHRQALLEAERTVVVVTDYGLAAPTSFDFVSLLLSQERASPSAEDFVLRRTAEYFADLTLMSRDLALQLPSVRAKACVAVAAKVLRHCGELHGDLPCLAAQPASPLGPPAPAGDGDVQAVAALLQQFAARYTSGTEIRAHEWFTRNPDCVHPSALLAKYLRSSERA